MLNFADVYPYDCLLCSSWYWTIVFPRPTPYGQHYCMKRVRFYSLAIGFALMLILPTLDNLFHLSDRFAGNENRRLSERPTFHFPHVGTYVSQFDRYFKENFGWRNFLFFVYSRWKYYGLGTSPLPEKVVVGRNGWFYLGNSYNNVVQQHQGLMPLSVDSARIITQRLVEHQQQLAQQGIKLYVFIAPDSHTIYPEYLPDHLRVSDRPSRLDVFKQYVTQHSSLPLIDVRDTLIRSRQQYEVYYRTDTHWNDYGTLVGCAALIERIRQDVPTIPPVRKADFRITSMSGGGGDLVQMLTLEKEVKDRVFYDIKPAPFLIARQTATVPDTVTGPARSGFPSLRFIGPDPRRPRLLLIGDSFSHSMTQFMPGYFGESYFVRTSRLDPALIRAEKPDVVVIEIVERNLDWLARF